MQLLERARAEVEQLRNEGLASEAANVKMRSTFEACAKRALRRPDPMQRSVALRAAFRRWVPASLRPTVKKMVNAIVRRGRQR